MADDFQNYMLQLQQVEAALLSDEANPELLKLKQDLEEVIALSKDLKSSLETEDTSPYQNNANSDDSQDAIPDHIPYIPSDYPGCSSKQVPKKWKVGDHCLAKWSENRQFCEAVIDYIQPDGQVNVTFLAYQNRAVVTLDEIKEIKEKFIEVFATDKKKHLKSNQYLKKKKQKKQQMFKELEQGHEQEKNKWLAFRSKAVKKGVKTKSIFTSPDNVNGRVGIGTCGISGKPMTEFATAEKWKK